MHELVVKTISIRRGFHLSPHAAFHNFKLSLVLLNIVKCVNKSDFKICMQISPVMVQVFL